MSVDIEVVVPAPDVIVVEAASTDIDVDIPPVEIIVVEGLAP